MKNYLFAALLLGSFIAFISSQSESFDFIDSQGRCWRCESGSCNACPASILPRPEPIPSPRPWPNFPNDWDRTCPPPTTEICAAHPTLKFPSNDINWYWDCANQNGRFPVRCECDKGFFTTRQACVYSDEIMGIGCHPYTDDQITPCTTTAATTTTVPTTTANSTNTTPPPCACIPFWPCRCNPCWHMPCHNCHGCGWGK